MSGANPVKSSRRSLTIQHKMHDSIAHSDPMRRSHSEPLRKKACSAKSVSTWKHRSTVRSTHIVDIITSPNQQTSPTRRLHEHNTRLQELHLRNLSLLVMQRPRIEVPAPEPDQPSIPPPPPFVRFRRAPGARVALPTAAKVVHSKRSCSTDVSTADDSSCSR